MGDGAYSIGSPGSIRTGYAVLTMLMVLCLALVRTPLSGVESDPHVEMTEDENLAPRRVVAKDGSRAVSLDIELFSYNFQQNYEYKSVGLNYTPVIEIINNGDSQADDVFANLTIFASNGTAVWADQKSDLSVGPSGGGKINPETVEFEEWIPEYEGVYRLYFKIGYSSPFYSDPDPTNNALNWSVGIIDKVDLSLWDIDFSPERQRYPVDTVLNITVEVRNHALTGASFELYMNITHTSSPIPLYERTSQVYLPGKTDIGFSYKYAFSKVSNYSISISIVQPENVNEDSTFGREINVFRFEPPVPIITQPVSNVPQRQDPISYYSDEPLRLDASDTLFDNNTTARSYDWRSDLAGFLSDEEIDNVKPGVVGVHRITLTVSDGYYTRSTNVYIEVSHRGTVELDKQNTAIEAQYTSTGEVSVEIGKIADPGAAYPKKSGPSSSPLSSLNIFRKVSLMAEGLSVHWLNVSVDYSNNLKADSETVTDENTITLYRFDEESVRWKEVGKQGIDITNKKIWAYIPEPRLTEKLGVFSDTKLKVAKLIGTIYGKNPATGDKEVLSDVKISYDRGGIVEYSDENGRFVLVHISTKKFELKFSKNGYKSREPELYVEKGELRDITVNMELKIGSVNGTVVEYMDENNTLGGVHVRLVPLEGQVPVRFKDEYETTTTGNGSFIFLNIPIGNYRLVLTPRGDFIEGGLQRVSVEEGVSNFLGNVSFKRHNNPPEIELITISPSTGIKGDIFRFSILYKDPDGEPPDVVRFRPETPAGPSVEMFRNYSSGSNYTQGVRYDASWIASSSDTFLFRFSARDERERSAPSITAEVVVKEPPKRPEEGLSVLTIALIFLAAILVLGLGVFLFLKFKSEKYYCLECGAKVKPDEYECWDCGAELPDFLAEDWDEGYYEEREREGEEEIEEVYEEEEEEIDYDTYSSIR